MTSSTLASKAVTDTVGLVLRIEHRKSGQKARAHFEAAETGNTTIYIPTMVFAEILYLSEKRRIQISLGEVEEYLMRYPNYKEYPMSFSVIQKASEITDIPELHDRLIAATARLLNLELITNDPVIAGSTFVRTIW